MTSHRCQDILIHEQGEGAASLSANKRKIRAAVKDRAVAEKLIPNGYAYGTRRQPLYTNHYETFNISTNCLR